MGVMAAFDYSKWLARYPEFANVSSDQAAALWLEAALYHRNDGGGPVADISQQGLLLNMLTAHLAFLNFGTISQSASPLVGRVSSASEGSVSVSVDVGAIPGSASWFAQTKYGLSYWQATAGYRTMRWRGPATRRFR